MASGFIAVGDVISIPQREGCPDTEFEDLFDPALYLEQLRDELGLMISVAEFDEARQRSGDRGRRFAKWSDVMATVAAARGMNWDDISTAAKTAVANGVSAGIRRGDGGAHLFVATIATKVAAYLRQQ